MAQTLTMPEGSNLSPEQYVAWLEEYDAADKEVAEAVAARKDLRSKIKVHMPLAAFDRARKDAQVAAARREHEEAWYQRLMAWQGKPVGSQASLDLDDAGQAAAYQRRLTVAEQEGYTAGRAGRRIDECSWPAGSEGAQRWHSGWHRGQAERVHEMGGEGGAANGASGPKRPGRPKGSKNKGPSRPRQPRQRAV